MDTDMARMARHGAAKSFFVHENQRNLSVLDIWRLSRLLGGDLASRYPVRVAAGMLYKAGVNVEEWLMKNSQHLPYGETEAKLILNQLKKGTAHVETTSCGRVLDAVAAVLGVCFERTYEGEPAMKLESTALAGKDILKLKPILHGDVLDTTYLLKAIYDNLGKVSTADLAYSAHAYLAKGLASLAVQKAQCARRKKRGFLRRRCLQPNPCSD